MNEDKETFERIYSKPGAGWTLEEPPEELKKLVESEIIPPGKALDIGCGEGFYSIYLASKGFEVLGIDLSEHAIKLAIQNGKQASANVRFKAIDIADLGGMDESFNFVLEWSILHHIEPKLRSAYAANIARKVNKNGYYLSLCFNDESKQTSGSEHKFSVSPVGTKLYYTSQEQIRNLFEQHFEIVDLRHSEILGRFGQKHSANYCLMKKTE